MRKLVIEGSLRSAGAQIGEATAVDLPFVRDGTIDFLLKNATVGGIRQMRWIAARYVASARDFFPEAIDYMEGLAFGGGLTFEDVALIVFSEEIRTEFHVAPEKCSTLAVPTRDGWLIGHNEDYEPQYFGKMFALDLSIPGYPRTLSLNYPGQLPCMGGSLGRVAIVGTSLWPDAVPGLSKNLLHFRAAVANDRDEALDFLTRQPAALTGHYTVGFGGDDSVCGLETSNPATADSYLCVHDPGREPYWHTNHVRFLKLRAPDPAVTDQNHSLPRGEKLRQIIADGTLPSTPDALLDLLSTNDGVLHRTPEQNATSVTLATVVIRPRTGEMWIRDADPSAHRRDLKLSFAERPLT